MSSNKGTRINSDTRINSWLSSKYPAACGGDLYFPGALYHVTSRGNARQRVFRDDEDRETFLATLAWVVARSTSSSTYTISGLLPGR